MDKGEKIKNGLRNIGWLVAFPVPVTKALAKKKGGKLGKKTATIAVTWAMYVGLATAGVSAMVPKATPENKTIDSIGYVVDDQGQIDETDTSRLPKDIKIHDHTEILGIGEELSVIASVVPFNVDDEYAKLSWTSSDESVATVNEYGKVTAVGLGTVVITAKATNDITKSFEIVVAESRIVKANVRVTSENETFNIDDWMFYLYIDEDADHDYFKPEEPISEDGYSAEYQLVVGRTISTYVTFNYRYKNGKDIGYAAEHHKVTTDDLETGFEIILSVDFAYEDGESDFPDENIVVTVDFEKKHPEVQQIDTNKDVDVEHQTLNMRVSSSYVGYTDYENWDMYYLVNGEKLTDNRSIVTVGEELTFTVVFRKRGDDSTTYEKSITRTVMKDNISMGMNVSMYVDVMEDNGMGREVEKEILARLDLSFE